MAVTERPATRSRLKAVLVGVILTVLAVVVLIGLALAFLPGPALRAGLLVAGYRDVAFADVSLGPGGLEATGITLGQPPDHRVERLWIGYRPGGLLEGRLDEVVIDGLVLRGRLDQQGLHLAGLDGGPPAAGKDAALPPLPVPERVAIHDARLELETPFGGLLVPLSLELRPDDGEAAFTIRSERARLAGAAGELVAELRLDGRAPLPPDDPLARLSATGRVELAADRLAVAGVADGIGGRAALGFALAPGEVDAVLSDLTLKIGELEGRLRPLRSLMPPPWRVELEDPLGVAADFQGDGIELEGEGRIAITSAGPRVEAAASAALRLRADGDLDKLVVPDAEFQARDVRWAGFELERATVRLDGAGNPEAWQADVAIDLLGAGEPWPGLRVEGARLRQAVAVDFARGRLEVAASEAGELQVEEARWREAFHLDALSVRLPPGDPPLAKAQLEEDPIPWRLTPTAVVPALDLTLLSATEPLRANADIADLAATMEGSGTVLATARVAIGGGRVRLPAYQIQLAGMSAEIDLSEGGLAPDQPIELSIGAISHGGEPAWFTPLRLSVMLHPEGERVGFEAALSSAAGVPLAELSGSHELAAATGSARVELAPLEFAAGGLQPADLAPLLVDQLEDVSGRLALDGTLRWTAGGEVRGDLDLLLDGLALTAGPARVEQINGVIRLDGLLPPSTPPAQRVAIGLLDIGLPLTNGVVRFQLTPDGTLASEDLSWRFAGGTVSAEPFTVGSAASGFTTNLHAEGLDLAQLFDLARLDGLTGQGSLSGSLPIRVSGTEAVVEGGELVAGAPGWIRYRPDAAPAALQAGGENVNLLLEALENFRYEALRITLDGRTDAEMDIGLHIAGANPDLYDGYPIEFNLNLEGELANILRSGLASYQIPERIGEQMRGFGR